MKIEKLSPSAYKDYCHCPHAYFIGNNLYRRFEGNKAANRGTISHRVIELLCEQILAKSKGDSTFTTKELGEVGVDEELNIAVIGRQTFEYQTSEVLNYFEWDEKDFKECMSYVDVALNFQNGKYDPRNRIVVDAERRIDLEIDEDWAILPDGGRFKMTGYMDVVYGSQDGKTYEIVDWKTGQQKNFHTDEPYNHDTLRNDIQLKMYHYAATKIYGEDKDYLVTMFFLKTKAPISICFSHGDLLDTKERIRKQLSAILKDKTPRRNISYKCKRFCDYGKNTFEGTDIVPQQQIYEDGIARPGDIMTVCDQVYYELSRFSIDEVQEMMKVERKKKDDAENAS